MNYEGLRFSRNSTFWALLLGLVGFPGLLWAEDFDWSYDFSSGSVADDWNFNTNNPAVTFSEFISGTAAFGYSGTPTFQASAIHEDSYALEVGDSLNFRLAWSPFNTSDSSNGNNEVFQLGAINLDGQSWETSTDRLATGDGFWLAGREIESTAPAALDEWGTQKLNLWLHTDELSSALLDVDVANSLGAGTSAALELGYGLGSLDIDSFKQGSDGSISATFLDIDLALTLVADGTFDYEVEIFSYEWTVLGGMTSWFDKGKVFSSSGARAHQLESRDALNATVGFLVADSSQLGVSSSMYSQAPLRVPEPFGATLLLVGLGFFGLGRRRS